MRKFVLASLAMAAPVLAALTNVLTTVAAHEGHKIECSATALNAINADIQSMNDGDTKTAAINEMTMAEETMKKSDLEACTAHLHSAREAIDK